MRRLKRGWIAGAGVLWLAWSATASAQTDAELDAARARFAEGVRLSGQRRWADAEAAFREVLEVRVTSQVRYNLAFALVQQDEIVEGARLLDEVLADPALADGVRDDSRTLLDEIEPRLGRLTIRLAGDEAGVTVLLDGEALPIERVGTPQRVAVGEHAIVVRHGEEERAHREVTVAAGGDETVLLSTGSVMMAAELPPPDDPADDDGGEDLLGAWWLWTIVGAVVAVGIGVTIGIVVASDGSVQPVAGNLDPGFLTVTP
ncbi:MAG: hypothetical protein H6719_15155 [Sandaracinaceae bacterium]|nr:hypothetical protein [Sandaracinaceae bacterium]